MATENGAAEIAPLGSESFHCSICLELVFKPIVNACGHVFCFWCMHWAMDSFGLQQSACPICRGAYGHFPRICETLHNFLAKAMPDEYKEREKDVREYEDRQSVFSPELPTGCASEEPLSRKDLLCSRCDRLLFHPVALCCGHMFCQPCVLPREAGVTKCPTCEFAHRTHPLKICLELDEYLKHAFPEEYKERTAALSSGGSSDSTSCTSGTSGSYSEPAMKGVHHRLSGIHFGAGCDSCGVVPIRGIRYGCEECHATNKMSYDLCEACYEDQSSNLTGRFNQQHTRDHTMRVMDPALLNFDLVGDEDDEDLL